METLICELSATAVSKPCDRTKSTNYVSCVQLIPEVILSSGFVSQRAIAVAYGGRPGQQRRLTISEDRSRVPHGTLLIF